MHELMAEEVEEICGPRGKHDPTRVAYRHGSDEGEVTLGSRRVGVQRPRMRAKDEGGEVPVETYEHFARRDVLSAVVLERMLAGVSTRRFVRAQEPVGERVEAEARSTSKSAVSRTFVARTSETLKALMSRRLEDVRLAVLMLDGIVLKDHTNVVALGITTEGVKVPLGLWESSTENKTVATSLLADLGPYHPDHHTGATPIRRSRWWAKPKFPVLMLGIWLCAWVSAVGVLFGSCLRVEGCVFGEV
jgi:transposase-like protein